MGVQMEQNPAQFENRIKALVYERRITRYTMYKRFILLAVTGVRKISSVACGFCPIKIHFPDHPKSLISRKNEVYVFSIKYRCGDILLKKKQQTSFITVCFAAITLVVKLAWLL